MKQGWKYKKLGEAATFINGYAFKPDQWKEYGTPIVRIQNLNNPNAPYNYFDGEVPDKVKIQNGDLLISWSASLGAYIWNGGNAFLNQHIFKVAFDKTDVDKIYLKYAVTSKLETMAGKVHGATMKHIVKKDFDNTLIPYPPKSTQLSIVSELDKINELIRLKKEQLKDYDNLAQSIFYEMFGDPVENEKGWEVKHLGELCDKISNGYNAKLEEDTYKTEGIMYFRCQNVWRNHFDYSDLVYIDEDTNQKMKSSSLKHNDFLITKIGRINTENSSLGRVSLYEGDDDKANLSGNLCFARLTKDIAVHKFILYILISNQFRNYIRRTTVGGIDKRALNVKQISSFPIISPPLHLQHLFAQRIEQIERQRSAVQKSITDLETLLASRMQYWFE